MTQEERIPKQAISLNSIGYFPDQRKRATVNAALEDGADFEILDSKDHVVYRSTISRAADLEGLENPLFHADFSAYQTPGTYRLKCAELVSAEFRLGSDVYNESLKLIMTGFYGQRCGVPVEFEHKGQVYSKKACHLQDGYLDYYDPESVGQQREACGGWHDAGDYGKYVVNAAFASGIMLKAWEHYPEKLKALTAPCNGAQPAGNLPYFLDEIRFNLEWILKMQFVDGKVSHKLTRTDFSAMIMPSEDDARRYFVPFGTDAMYSFVAVCSQAARVYRAWDLPFAERCLKAAALTMKALQEIGQPVRSDMSSFRTGRYQRMAHSDHIWALFEYWEASGDPDVFRLINFETAHENYHVDVDWDWGLGKNLGIYTFICSSRERPRDLVKELESDLLKAADRIIENWRAHPYGRGLSRCYWGCNGSIARTSMNLSMAARISGDMLYQECLLDQLSYLYGNNPFARSFVTGDGHNPPRFPHHRPSVADGIDEPWPGHLVGGPHPTELDWFDVTEDARTNENAINWDAALVYALAGCFQA